MLVVLLRLRVLAIGAVDFFLKLPAGKNTTLSINSRPLAGRSFSIVGLTSSVLNL